LNISCRLSRIGVGNMSDNKYKYMFYLSIYKIVSYIEMFITYIYAILR